MKEGDIRALVDRTKKSKRSPLYLAMRKDFKALEKAFAEDRPNWKDLVEGFKQLGILSGNGKELELRTAQQTWYRVKADVQGRKLKAVPVMPKPPPPQADSVFHSAPSQPRPGAMPAAEPAARPASGFDPHESADEPPARTTFRTSGGLKKWPNPASGQDQ